MKKYSIGIDVGATNIKVGLFDGEMKLIDHVQTLIDQDADLNRLMDYIAALAKRIAEKNGIEINGEDGKCMGLAIYSGISDGGTRDKESHGMLTGTASTGVILLREIDGNFKTPAADNLVYQTFPACTTKFFRTHLRRSE